SDQVYGAFRHDPVRESGEIRDSTAEHGNVAGQRIEWDSKDSDVSGWIQASGSDGAGGLITARIDNLEGGPGGLRSLRHHDLDLLARVGRGGLRNRREPRCSLDIAGGEEREVQDERSGQMIARMVGNDGRID